MMSGLGLTEGPEAHAVPGATSSSPLSPQPKGKADTHGDHRPNPHKQPRNPGVIDGCDHACEQRGVSDCGQQHTPQEGREENPRPVAEGPPGKGRNQGPGGEKRHPQASRKQRDANRLGPLRPGPHLPCLRRSKPPEPPKPQGSPPQATSDGVSNQKDEGVLGEGHKAHEPSGRAGSNPRRDTGFPAKEEVGGDLGRDGKKDPWIR